MRWSGVARMGCRRSSAACRTTSPTSTASGCVVACRVGCGVRVRVGRSEDDAALRGVSAICGDELRAWADGRAMACLMLHLVATRQTRHAVCSASRQQSNTAPCLTPELWTWTRDLQVMESFHGVELTPEPPAATVAAAAAAAEAAAAAPDRV
eukprot:1234421-Rhodomonas_salina.2